MRLLRHLQLAALPPLLLAAAAAPSLAGGEAPGDTFFLRAGKVYTCADDGPAVYAPGLLLVQDGKIVSVGPAAGAELPAGVPLVDRPQSVVMPGLVAAQLVLRNGARDEDTAAAGFSMVDGFDLYADHEQFTSRGLTTAFLHPGRGRLVTGRGAVVKLAGEAGPGRILSSLSDLCAEVGEAALNPPDKVEISVPSSSDVPIEPGQSQRPGSRLALVSELRRQLRQALIYQRDRDEKSGDERPERDLNLETLARVLDSGRMRIDARRESEILGVLQLLQLLELSPTPVLSGASEAGPLARELASLDLPVIYEMPYSLRGAPLDRRGHPDRVRHRTDTPAKLAAAGVRLALAAPPGAERNMLLLAGLAVRGGLDGEQALRAVTSDAAAVLGVSDRTGSLAPGKDADFLVLSHEPLSSESEVMETWIDGRPVYQATPSRSLVVRAGTILTAAGDPIYNGEVLIQEGVIAAVGSSVPHPPGAAVLDAGPDGYVTPGFVDAYGHLGLQGDASSVSPSVELHGLLAGDHPAALEVARAGVTTTLMAPWGVGGSGGRVVARKTAAPDRAPGDVSDRSGLVVEEVAGMVFDIRGGDPLTNRAGSVIGRLRAAKGYQKQWLDYAKKLAAWKEAQKNPKQEKKAEKKEPEKKPEKPQPAKADPITGTWEGTIRGPRTATITMRLVLEGSSVKAVLVNNRGQEQSATATWDGKKLTIRLPVPNPQVQQLIEATLSAPDTLTGALKIIVRGRVLQEVPFSAKRTSKGKPSTTAKVGGSGGSGGSGDKPLPPNRDPAQEAMLEVIEGKAVLFLWADNPGVVKRALASLKSEKKLRVVFVNFADADLIADDLGTTGVLLLPGSNVREDEHVIPTAMRLARSRVPFAFMSNAEDGARELPLRAVAAVRRGLSEGDALRALTIEAARLTGLEERVGSLAPGKDGDLLVFSGPPFEPTSRLKSVVVGGRLISPEEE